MANDERDDDRLIQLELDRFPDANEIPNHIVELLDELPFVVGGEGDKELEAIQGGLCICCSRPLGDHTILSIGSEGITSIVCSGPCHDDLMIVGYLHEQLTDLIERVDMRRNVTEGHD